MKHVVKADTFLEKRRLEVDESGIRFMKPDILQSWTKWDFARIDCVLLSSSHELSVQAGGEVFSIATRPYDATHQAAIAALVAGARQANGLG